jgi:hypothetical protein
MRVITKLYNMQTLKYEYYILMYGPNTYGKIAIAKLCSNCITISKL